jgi:hypothetical protein
MRGRGDAGTRRQGGQGGQGGQGSRETRGRTGRGDAENNQSPIPNPHYPLSPEGGPPAPYPQRGPRVPQSPLPLRP